MTNQRFVTISHFSSDRTQALLNCHQKVVYPLADSIGFSLTSAEPCVASALTIKGKLSSVCIESAKIPRQRQTGAVADSEWFINQWGPGVPQPCLRQRGLQGSHPFSMVQMGGAVGPARGMCFRDTWGEMWGMPPVPQMQTGTAKPPVPVSRMTQEFSPGKLPTYFTIFALPLSHARSLSPPAPMAVSGALLMGKKMQPLCKGRQRARGWGPAGLRAFNPQTLLPPGCLKYFPLRTALCKRHNNIKSRSR